MSLFSHLSLPVFVGVFEYLFGQFLNLPNVPPNTFGDILVIIHSTILTTTGVFYFYQVVFSFLSLFIRRKKVAETENFHKYIIVTFARNEENVIKQLATSINNLNYPKDKYEMHILCDNCTDNTPLYAQNEGFKVFIRNDEKLVGKSHAMDYYFKKVMAESLHNGALGYVVIDTDNLFDPNFLREINKTYEDTQAKIIAGYRNSTNPGESLWAFGTAYAFLREISLLHKVREVFGLSSYVSGTGFFVSHQKIVEQNGWPFHSLIEDIEFSSNHVIGNERVAFAHDAIFYDEQPNKFIYSYRQRLRWVKGLYQVSFRNFGRLIKSFFKDKVSFKQKVSTYENILFVTPLPTITVVWYIIYGVLALINVLFFSATFDYFVLTYVYSVIDLLLGLFVFTTVMALMISISNWKRIRMSGFKKIVYPFFGFFYLITYIPILIIGIFSKPKWQKVPHFGVGDGHELLK